MARVHADSRQALEYGEITQMGDKAALFKYVHLHCPMPNLYPSFFPFISRI